MMTRNVFLEDEQGFKEDEMSNEKGLRNVV